MQWLNKIVEELIAKYPEGEIVVSSGVSPSGTYHLGTLREVLTAEVIAREVNKRGRKARHIHIADDLDIFRKVPVGVPDNFKDYLGMPLCDVPAPDGSNRSYADFYLADLYEAAKELKLEMEVVRAHEKYRSGYFVPAIEKALSNIEEIKNVLTDISGRKLDDQWSPVQVVENGYLKNRKFVSIDTNKKTITYLDKDEAERQVSYQHGQVKLNWRIDWPARWWLLAVKAEPFGRDHATKGGSYDTGVEIAKKVFETEAPLPVPYNFINRTGDTKKMSKSAGDTVTAADLLKIIPAEIVMYFVLRFAPDKLLFFDDGPALMKLVDEFSELISKPEKTKLEAQLIEVCTHGLTERTVSNIPFTHLVASYQASLKDVDRTLEVIARTEHAKTAQEDADIIRNELRFIDEWLKESAPEEIRFELVDVAKLGEFSVAQKKYLNDLASVIEHAPKDADGAWFHAAIYQFKDTEGLDPKQLFSTLYQAVIAKNAGPRAGWFLSILPREWLLKRLRLEA